MRSYNHSMILTRFRLSLRELFCLVTGVCIFTALATSPSMVALEVARLGLFLSWIVGIPYALAAPEQRMPWLSYAIGSMITAYCFDNIPMYATMAPGFALKLVAEEGPGAIMKTAIGDFPRLFVAADIAAVGICIGVGAFCAWLTRSFRPPIVLA